MRPGILLYGPPASGKDTITAELVRIDSRYQLFRKLKVGSGRADGYRMIDRAAALALQARGEIIYANERYGNLYAVDVPEIRALRANGAIPVLHMGQIAGVMAALDFEPGWLFVILTCRRETTAARARDRGSSDVEARLQAWDETLADLQASAPLRAHLPIDTDADTPAQAAAKIHAAMVAA